jgi:hypothetical protein
MSTNQIADGGGWRLREGQKNLASESIEKKYAAQLAQAGPDEKKQIYQRIMEEHQRREKMISHQPSPKALW